MAADARDRGFVCSFKTRSRLTRRWLAVARPRGLRRTGGRSGGGARVARRRHSRAAREVSGQAGPDRDRRLRGAEHGHPVHAGIRPRMAGRAGPVDPRLGVLARRPERRLQAANYQTTPNSLLVAGSCDQAKTKWPRGLFGCGAWRQVQALAPRMGGESPVRRQHPRRQPRHGIRLALRGRARLRGESPRRRRSFAGRRSSYSHSLVRFSPSQLLSFSLDYMQPEQMRRRRAEIEALPVAPGTGSRGRKGTAHSFPVTRSWATASVFTWVWRGGRDGLWASG